MLGGGEEPWRSPRRWLVSLSSEVPSEKVQAWPLAVGCCTSGGRRQIVVGSDGEVRTEGCREDSG